MDEEVFDVVIVGGGLAGCAAAYALAKAGVEVVVVERGAFSGSKNMTGGRLYGHSLESESSESCGSYTYLELR